MRSKNLEICIRNILNDPGGNDLAKKFYDHPLVKGLNKKGQKPSYIPSRVFALSLMDIMAPADPETGSITIDSVRKTILKMPEEQDGIKRTVLLFLDEAENDINKARQNMEEWFDETMKRVSGWYKRKSQWIILGYAIIVTLALNIDTITVANTLFRDSTMRAGLVAAAQEIAKQPLGESPDDTHEKIKQIQVELEKIQFPVGWKKTDQSNGEGYELPKDFLSWIIKICGWAITALAVSLGAPFWFDMLNKFINIRSSGNKPQELRERKTASGP
jgi:hypothetical protein